MQREARITSKGQITVPKAVRHALGLKPGDKVVFEQEGEEISEGEEHVRQVSNYNCFKKW
jgi:AbrB family looped-hinge helix DNA binding protein